MSPAEQGLLIGQIVTFLVGASGIIVALINKKARTPADDNESIRLGNEFLRGLLSDAKTEREELRKTIEELREERTSHVASIVRLESLLKSKDTRIDALEALLQDLTEKLQQGQQITLEDILGTYSVPVQAV